MIYQPEVVTAMWDPSVMYHDSTWYMFYMIGKNPGEWNRKAMCLAISVDAVHWEEIGPIVDHRDYLCSLSFTMMVKRLLTSISAVFITLYLTA